VTICLLVGGAAFGAQVYSLLSAATHYLDARANYYKALTERVKQRKNVS
jgi:hypothetical protein